MVSGTSGGKGSAVTTWQEVAARTLADAYPGTLSPADIGEAIRKSGVMAWSREGLSVWLRHQVDLGAVEHPAFKQYRAVIAETSPEALRDLIGVAAGVMIPGPVIATWTPAERRAAEQWAASEHLRASDNTGIAPRPYPRLVQEAVVLAANPGMAQLAVEAWMQRKESIERELSARGEQGSVHAGYAGSMHQETANIAQAAITGLLVLLDGEAGAVSPWVKALAILGSHPEGIAAKELSVLLGKDAPGQEALDGWLEEGIAAGTFKRFGGRVWMSRGAGG